MNARPAPPASAGDTPRTRDFSPEDQPAVGRLIQDGLRHRWGASYDPSFNPDIDDLTTNYIAPGGQVVVAEIQSEIVAAGILCLEPAPAFLAPVATEPTVPRLRRISVSEEHRRKGLGRLIVEELFNRATALGFGVALVSTDTPWTDAVALYQSCGFVTVHTDTEETHLLRRAAGR